MCPLLGTFEVRRKLNEISSYGPLAMIRLQAPRISSVSAKVTVSSAMLFPALTHIESNQKLITNALKLIIYRKSQYSYKTALPLSSTLPVTAQTLPQH
jgi:hypothetical protein